MRKKFASLILSLLFLGILFVAPASSQEDSLSFEQALLEYSRSTEDYRSLHDAYILARAQYLRFGTQKSKTEAKDATVAMLQARDEVVIDYLQVLKARLNETPGVSTARRESLTIKIDTEIDWFRDHKALVPSAGDLEDLVDDSDEAEEKYDATQPLFYEILANISYGKINDYRERLEDVLLDTKDKLEEVRTEEGVENSFSITKMQNLERWIFESESLIARSREKQQEADELLTELVSGRRRRSRYLGMYNQIIENLVESQQLLREATSYLGELIREVKVDG